MNIQDTRYISQIIYLVLVTFTFFISLKYFLLLILLTTLLGGVFFCGWLCPFGAMQEMINKLGRLIKLPQINIPKKAHKYFILTRYLLFFLILAGLISSFVFDARISFIDLLRGDKLAIFAYVFLISFIIVSIFTERFFCNYFCMEGARYGLFSFFRIFRIRRNKKSCINCKLCDQSCPMNINISKKEYVHSLQCINCLNCLSNCPKKKVLGYSLVNPLTIIKDKFKN